ncbi:flagellar protein export ATPase FliI [Marinibaculum pumilum]|uniref:Flagellum-specific ATP synthase n=1 Tax=Marinibaculum pumilum TaxID=1766165 RepID=A0ABV7L023_9PROT
MSLDRLADDIGRIAPLRLTGRVAAVQGLLLEIAGIGRFLGIGARLTVARRGAEPVSCEVVGFRGDRALALPFGGLTGVGVGSEARLVQQDAAVSPDMAWLGRVVSGTGHARDGGPPLATGPRPYLVHGDPPPAEMRDRMGAKIDLGIRALNTFVTCCRGQRMGIFAGSGVGKSMLMSMLARYSGADIIVIGLIGERGREVQDFLADTLGPEGLARSVVVVATSDESALLRRQAAFMTMTVAEFFRDQGLDVLCLMDSVTRFAQAQREIGLAGGEPPATRGYPPTVFSELPRLLERAGPGMGGGSITGLFSVLVEGDDHNEPISDAVRGILDGHITLDRSIAERGRFPAINILRSVSRALPGCNSDDENVLVGRARRLMATYEDMADMIRIGAYRRGSNPEVDEAIAYRDRLEAFLTQGVREQAQLEQGYAELQQILG